MRIIRIRCIPLRLKSMTQWRATSLLPTWIYSCRSGERVSCALTFTTSLTISTPYHKLFVPEKQYSILASVWSIYLTAHTVYQNLLNAYEAIFSQMLHDILGYDHIQNRIGPYTDFDLITKFRVGSIEHF